MQPNSRQASAKNIKRIGSVQNGKFVQDEPDHVITQPREHSLHRQFVRDRGREDFGRDLVQKYKHGELNPEWIEAYPEVAREQIKVEEQ